MEIDIENRKSYLYIKVSGNVSLTSPSGWQEVKSVRGEIIEKIIKNRIYAILFDCRECSVKLSTLGRFLFATIVAEENEKLVKAQIPPLKITFVVNKYLIDPGKFGEKVAHDRGLNGLVTDNIHEAMRWIELNSPLNEAK